MKNADLLCPKLQEFAKILWKYNVPRIAMEEETIMTQWKRNMNINTTVFSHKDLHEEKRRTLEPQHAAEKKNLKRKRLAHEQIW